MKRFCLTMALVIGFSYSVQASTLDYNPYYTTANYTMGIDFSNIKVKDGNNIIPVTNDMVSNYDPNKIGRQVIKITYNNEEFDVPIFLTQKAPASMTKDGYIKKSESIINTDTLTETYPNEIITIDKTTSDSALVPMYTGADGRPYNCYMYTETDTNFKVWGNSYLNYYLEPVTIPFKDIQGKWYEDVCARVYKSGIMLGTSSSQFSPNEYVTRAQICRVLYKLAGQPILSYDGRYVDVKRTDWFASSVFWYYNEILKEERKHINPDFYVSRDEMAHIICKCLDSVMPIDKVKLPAMFKDIDKCVYSNDVIKLQQMGLISGNDNQEYEPSKLVTRAEFATIISNYINSYIEGRS